MINIIVDKLNLEQLGFSKTTESEYYQNLYVKKVEGAKFYLDINIEGDFVYSFGGWITINLVENLLRPLCQKYNFENYRDDTIIKGINVPSKESLLALQRAQKIRLNTSDNIDKVVSYLKIYLDQYLIPFFDKYGNIHNFNNDIVSTVPHSQLSDYIPGFMPFKKLIILFANRSVQFEEYSEWLKKGLQVRFEKGVNQAYFLLFNDILIQLDENKEKI